MSDGIVIDISEWLKAEKKPPSAEGATVDRPTPDPPPPAKVQMEAQQFSACQHKVFSIDDKQRTVKCGDCKLWLDPVWCLRELFRYYEQRVDWRLQAIKAFEEKQAAAGKRRRERRAKPRKAKAQTMRAHLERAAYNEYQSKILAARASAQRLSAEKIGRELTAAQEAGPGTEERMP
jgi:hypothetical protein